MRQPLIERSRLRHIDELMAWARSAPLKEESASRTEALLRQIESDRNKLAQELEEILGLPRGEGSIVMRADGLKGLLESVGCNWRLHSARSSGGGSASGMASRSVRNLRTWLGQ